MDSSDSHGIDLLISRNLFQPGHFIPKFSSINWGLCVPDTCQADDVKKMIDSQLREINVTTNLIIEINVDDDNCIVKSDVGFKFNLSLIMVL